MNKIKFLMAGGLAALMLGAGACSSTATQRSTGQTVDDSVLTARAKAALIENKDTKAHNINVEVYKGEVQLNGFVASSQEKAAAAATVKRVDGVTGVRNNLQVQTTQRSGGEAVDDALITTKVKAALIADSRTKAHQIEVTTKLGQVQLGGFVDSRSAKAAAEEVAGSVMGVKSINNGLEVKE